MATTAPPAMTGVDGRGTGTTAKGITLVLAQILPVMAIVSLFPAIPKLFEHFGGVGNAGLLVPMIVTVPSLCIALFAPVAGWGADRFGRRPCFVGGLALYVVAGLAPLLIDDLPTLVASRGVLGIAEALIITASSALIGDYFGTQRYRWAAWVGASTSIGGTLLIAAGGVLADVSWRGPFAVYALAIPCLILALIFIDEPVQRERDAIVPGEAGFQGYPWRAALLIGGVTLVASLLYYVEPLNVATVLVAKGAGSATQVGLIQAATSLAYIVGAFVYRRFHALPIGQLLAIAGVFMGIGVIVIGQAATYQMVAVGATIQQLGGGMIIPILLAWGQGILPVEQRGRGMGIWASAFFTGTFLCPPLVGAIGGATGGLQPAMLLMGAVTLVISIAAPFLFGRTQRVASPTY